MLKTKKLATVISLEDVDKTANLDESNDGFLWADLENEKAICLEDALSFDEDIDI